MRLLAMLLLPPSTMSLNILMYVMVAGKSHVQFAEKLIALMNENGHKVDVIMGMLNSRVILKGNYGGRHWGNVASHLQDPFAELSDWNRLKLQPDAFIDTAEEFCDALLDSREVSNLLTSNKYDLGLINGYDLCPFALAHHYQISSVVSYVPTPIYPTQYYYAGLPELPLYEDVLFLASHEDRSSFSRRVLETIRTLKERYVHIQAHTAITNKFRARFGNDFADVREITMKTSLDFCNSHPLLEEPRPISLRIRYIAGIGLPMAKPLSKELNNMLDIAPKGNVLFSLGTQIVPEKITDDLKRVFINTFKRFPEYNFLWKFDGKTAMNASNIFNLAWLPQTDLLNDHKVVAFISHMGLNSFTETAYAGVPVVAIPLFADQVHNARRAKALGIGEIVKNFEITEKNLYDALEKVLHNEKYRSRAKEISQMIAAQPDKPQRVFLEGIEFAAKFKNFSSHHRLVGANRHHFVQTGWDVAAFFTVIIMSFVFIVSKIVILVLRNLFGRIHLKQKISRVLVASCLILASLLAYFDSFGINGVIPRIQTHYNIDVTQTATSTSIAYTAALALVWLFGDAFRRRRLFLATLSIWIIFSLLSIFVGSQSFLIFVALRSLAVAASAVFEVLVPVMLADLFQDRTLGIALSCVSFGEIVVGMASLNISSWIVTNDVPWQSGLVAAPVLAIIPLIGVLCSNSILRDVELTRVGNEIGKNFAGAFRIFSIKSYLLLTATLSFIAFNTKAYNFWFPSMYILVWTNLPDVFLGLSYTTINMLNTIVMILGTVTGLPVAMWLAQSWRHGTGLFSGRKEFVLAYPIVAAIGAPINASLLILSIMLLNRSYPACLLVTFFVGMGSALNTVLINQMILLVVPPSSRTAAVALARLIASVAGIPSAQIAGAIMEALRGGSNLPYDQFRSYQLGMACTSSILFVGVLCHVILVFFYTKDYQRAEEREIDNEKTPLIEKS